MITGAARVAPEKAVFRPALPLSFSAGLIGQQMATRLTYKEKLLHPHWQRKRLEVMELAGWKCATCDAAEKTLHVHHKHYVKGREPWEYENSDLEVLCEDCHGEAHEAKAFIDRVVAQFPSLMWKRLASMLVGYGEEYVDPAEWLCATDDFARAGQVAWYMGNLSPDEALEASKVITNTDPATFMEMVHERRRQMDELADGMERFDQKTKPLQEGDIE